MQISSKSERLLFSKSRNLRIYRLSGAGNSKLRLNICSQVALTMAIDTWLQSKKKVLYVSFLRQNVTLQFFVATKNINFFV